MASSSSSPEALIQTLTDRGWCFRDIDQIKAIISAQSSENGGSITVDSIESELCNMDLRSIGGKSLPDPSLLRKSSQFQGPKVLQISSVRDIIKSSIAESSGNSSSRRLLKLKLTDGHSDITAVEFSHIPSIPDNVVPGTKVRLENKVVMHSGILCLNPKTVTVLGGTVQSLYEEWEMNQKYSGFTRSSLKLLQNDDNGGPPPFEKLQAGAPSCRINQQSRSSDYSTSIPKGAGRTFREKGGSSDSLQTGGSRASGIKDSSRDNDVKSSSLIEKTEDKQPAAESRPKEVAESVPMQNQAAAQKLLQKMNNPIRNERHSRGWKQRGQGMEESSVLTLDEWEKKRASESSSMRQELPNISQDEDLARQLQNQFDLEDLHVQRGPRLTEADDIRMSMFSFERDDPVAHGRTGSRGRGRGRSRGRGRGRDRFG